MRKYVVRGLVAGPYRPVAADKRRGAAIEALRAADVARRRRSRVVRVGRRKFRAFREAVEQVDHVQIREGGHVGDERDASQILPVRQSRISCSRCEAKPRVLANHADLAQRLKHAHGVRV